MILEQTELDQQDLDQPARIAETNWLTFTAYKVADYITRLINFTIHVVNMGIMLLVNYECCY